MLKKMTMMLAACALVACTPVTTAPPASSLPVVGAVCAQLQSDKFDLALRSYGVAVDAFNMAIDLKAIVPGSSRAVAIAKANDAVLLGFAAAESARKACNATSYAAAIANVYAGLAEMKAALRK